MDRRSLKLALALAGSLSLAVAFGCGEDEDDSGSDVNPTIVEILPQCEPSTDPQRYDGPILAQVQVTVSDPDGDVDFVTIAIGGTVLRVEDPDGEEGGTESVFTYLVPDDESLLRCEPGTVILVRAVDSAGHVAEGEAELL